ncbi:flagellar hook-length control protein FliK [Marinospirillum sp.]|uniref:flagellar hook-length control protein FliK n=1 Tax=Marinospirillum sp. TaxID=2183934 RepID=UPI00287001B1|nr:flagellar hook-length control protein FliK [Marinospirillum sp.]MDR9466732.1 flagellar hook-length control protein FliK [Marinospirillum sp.]
MQGLPPTRGTSADTSSHQANLLRGVITQGRPALPPGQAGQAQVVSSEPTQQGQGHRVQVQLNTGEQMTLRLDRPLAQGQQVQLQARAEGQVEVRLVAQNSPQGQTAQQLSQILSQLPTLSARPATGQSLPVNPGQTLLAQVVSSQTQAAAQGEASSSHRIQLQLPGGQQVSLIMDRPLQPGQQLQISRPDGSTSMQVKVLNPEALQLLDALRPAAPANPTASRTETASLQTLLQAAGAQLRQALPRQAPLSQALQQITQLARQLPAEPAAPRPQIPQPGLQPGNRATAAPLQGAEPTLKQHLSSLLSLIPQGNKAPTAQQLQAFIPASGLLLEANLVRGVQTNPLQGDLKLLLQQASAQLRGQGTAGQQANQQQIQQQLGQQLQAAQSRIQVLQQSSLQATQTSHERGQPAQVIQMDLPYSIRGDWFQAQLEVRRWIEEKDAEAAAEQEERKTRSWEVELSFDLKNWGRVHTRLKLKGTHLKADVWVEAKEAWGPMQKEVSVLEARLRRLGADVERIDCHLGKPPPRAPSKHPQQIIDTEI